MPSDLHAMHCRCRACSHATPPIWLRLITTIAASLRSRLPF